MPNSGKFDLPYSIRGKTTTNMFSKAARKRPVASKPCLSTLSRCRCTAMRHSKTTQKNEKLYEAAVKQITEEAIFTFEKIGFVDSVKAQCLAAPRREVINLTTKTALQTLGNVATETSAVQPCPTGSVADKMELQQSQHFDLTALVKEVSALRPTATTRKFFDVCLIDGSTNLSTGKMRTIKQPVSMKKTRRQETTPWPKAARKTQFQSHS